MKNPECVSLAARRFRVYTEMFRSKFVGMLDKGTLEQFEVEMLEEALYMLFDLEEELLTVLGE